MTHSDDELTEGLLKDHREHPLEVRPEAVALGYHPTPEERRKIRRKAWTAPIVVVGSFVLVMTAVVAVVSASDKDASKIEPTPSASPTEVASASASLAEWKFDVVGDLLPVFMDEGAMKSGDYRVNDLSAQTFCPSLVKDVTKAMNSSRPAPDDEVQKHFVAMLTSYKAAGDKCVAGDMDGSFAALQAGEKEQKAMEAK